MRNDKKLKEQLDKWKEIILQDEQKYAHEITLMDERENIYSGKHEISEILPGDKTTKTPHVRNIAAELIESQINSNIPQPRVDAARSQSKQLATLIEDMIRNKLNLLPTEAINDQMERTVPIQGGAHLTYDWDNSKRTHNRIGEGVLAFRHPKQVIPQDGVTSGIEDMDHITIIIPQTHGYIKRRYGVDVSDETEQDPSLRSAEAESKSQNIIDQYIVYYRNSKGGIGRFSWVGDTVLENFEDYQARHLRRCRRCGQPEPCCDVSSIPPTADGTFPIDEGKLDELDDTEIVRNSVGRDHCPYCGGTYKYGEETEMEVLVPFTLPSGEPVPVNTKIPYYKPDIYPVFLQKNISKFGKYLGESDVDKIRDQQNSINRLYAKILAQLLNGGSYITLPDEVSIKKDSEEGKVIRLKSAADINMIQVKNLTPEIAPAINMMEIIYKEAQQELGISDSFLGRRDPTATSGKAKEFSAAQAAGRLESKRVMKNEMYARLFEAMFKFELAYADEERPIAGVDVHGNHLDETWNKWLFLKKDSAGQWYWDDEFLFSVDSTAPLAQNREAMWQETRSHFESGAYGNREDTQTQLMYWETMAELHYPGAGKTKKRLEEAQAKQAKAQLEAAQAQKEALAFADSKAQSALDGAAVPDVAMPQPIGSMEDYGGGLIDGSGSF